MKYRFNWKAFLLTVGAVLVLAGGLYAAHRVQSPRNARALLALADRADADGQPDRALRYLGRYLTLNPSDVATRFRFAETMERLAAGGPGRFLAVEVYQRVVAEDPSRIDARRRLAVLLTETGRWEEAIGHLKILRDALPTDGPVVALLGKCHGARADWVNAAACFSSACRLPDATAESFARLADCQRRTNNPNEADRTIEQMVERFPRDHRAHLYRADYRARHRLAGADEDLVEAKRLAPDAPEVLLAVAEAAARSGDLKVAREELGRGIAVHPKDPRFYLQLSQLELTHGKAEGAIALLRRGVSALPEEAELVVELVHQLLDVGDLAAAKTVLTTAKTNPKVRWAANDLDLLTGRLAAAVGNWAEALPILEAVRRRVPSESARAAMIDRLLSQNALRIGDSDKQVELLRRSLAVRPNPAAQLEFANALVASGRDEEAVRVFKALVDAEPPSVPACLALARWNAARALDTVGPGGDWSEVERILDRAEKARPGEVLIAVTRAEIWAARGRTDDARKLLKAGCAITPPTPAPWVALAHLEFRAGRMEEARQTLSEAKRALGNEVTVLLMSIVLAAQQPAGRAVAETEAATGGADRLPPEQAVRVWRLAATLYLRLERYDLAARAAARVVALRPDNLQSHLLRFEAAAHGNDAEAAQTAIKEVQRIEGPAGGLAAYCEALRLVRKSTKQADKAEMVKARELLTEAGARRPGWPKVALLRGQLDLLEGQPDRAAVSYREAFDQGERGFELVRWLVEHYSVAGRGPEAADLIRRLQDKGTVSFSEQRLFTAVYLQAADYKRALEAAQRAVASNSVNPSDHVWLSHVYTIAKKFPEAETALVRACELAKTPEPWVARVQFLVTTKRPVDAEALLKEISTKVAKDQVELTLGACNEVLGRLAEADRRYAAALAGDPNGRATKRAVASYYIRTRRFALAEPILRQLLSLPGGTPAEIRETRRLLAVGLAESGDYRRCGEALALLGANTAEVGEDRADALTRAAVLAKRPGSKREALRLYQQLAEKPLPAEARYVFAQLQLITGGVAQGREQMLLAISQSGENPAYVATWVEALLAERQFEDAQYWVGQLAKGRADQWPVVDLQTRLLHARGRTADAAQRVARYVPKNSPEALAVALRLETYKDVAGAEKLFKETLAKPDVPPVAPLAYAAFLARQGRVTDALTTCETALGKLPPPVVAGAALEFLGSRQSDPAVFRRVEKWLTDVKPGTADARAAAYMRADALDRRGDYPGAIAAYRQLVEQEKDSTLALFPLASLLVHTGASAAEAEQLLSRAIATDGPKGSLLELKALALLRQGRAADAVALLSEAIAEQPTATSFVRLAAARLAANDKPGAEAAFAEATRRQVDLQPLHPLEAAKYRELQTALQKR